ncbi:hypothetical protein CBFG_01446 [Clostridiales bacterium 1_7_47FAA]|nr:hypothetical protein CBFG_01446 [Clostridiales bacterium 1_7_47FAA]
MYNIILLVYFIVGILYNHSRRFLYIFTSISRLYLDFTLLSFMVLLLYN